jgi:hypothetical protein
MRWVNGLGLFVLERLADRKAGGAPAGGAGERFRRRPRIRISWGVAGKRWKRAKGGRFSLEKKMKIYLTGLRIIQ